MPEQSIASAVIVQMSIVSVKTSTMPRIPWLTRSFVSTPTYAIGAEPTPASFEKTPRAAPTRIAFVNVKPAKPPATGLKLPNAPLNIDAKALPMLLEYLTITKSDMAT